MTAAILTLNVTRCILSRFIFSMCLWMKRTQFFTVNDRTSHRFLWFDCHSPCEAKFHLIPYTGLHPRGDWICCRFMFVHYTVDAHSHRCPHCLYRNWMCCVYRQCFCNNNIPVQCEVCTSEYFNLCAACKKRSYNKRVERCSAVAWIQQAGFCLCRLANTLFRVCFPLWSPPDVIIPRPRHDDTMTPECDFATIDWAAEKELLGQPGHGEESLHRISNNHSKVRDRKSIFLRKTLPKKSWKI